MNKSITNIPVSIHDRLLNVAKAEGRTYNDLLYIYTNERFLYRMSKSEHASKFVLKGAMAVLRLQLNKARYTRDIDLLGLTENSIVNITRIIQDICRINVDDGLFYAPERISSSSIKLHDDVMGVRTKIEVALGQKNINKLQLDIGFGDEVFPKPEIVEYGGMLNLPKAVISVYPTEAILAEKIHPFVKLGQFNSRMKDIYDIWLLASNQRIDGEKFSKSVRLVFENRDTSFPQSLVIFDHNFLDKNKRANWHSIGKKLQSHQYLPEIEDVLRELQPFLNPILSSLYEAKGFSLVWDPSVDWGWLPKTM